MTGNHHTSQARHIVSLLGGRTEATRITGQEATTINSWIRSGWIHGRYHRSILESAWAAGINMNELDFVVHLRGLARPMPSSERTAA